MSIYDLAMLAVLAGSILFGLWKGLAWQVASLAAIFVSYFVALNFSIPLSGFISASEPWNRFAAMLVLFLGTSLVIWMAYGYLKSSIERFRLRGFDAQAGALLGAIKGALLCMLITLFGVTLFGEKTRSFVVASRSGGYIAAGINRLNAIIPAEIHSILDPHIREFNENLTSENPGFLSSSEAKLNELQIFRGKFQLPVRPDSNRQTAPTGQVNSAAPSTEFVPGELPRTLENQFLDSAKSAGKKLLDDGVTAGQQLINDTSKR